MVTSVAERMMKATEAEIQDTMTTETVARTAKEKTRAAAMEKARFVVGMVMTMGIVRWRQKH